MSFSLASQSPCPDPIVHRSQCGIPVKLCLHIEAIRGRRRIASGRAWSTSTTILRGVSYFFPAAGSRSRLEQGFWCFSRRPRFMQSVPYTAVQGSRLQLGLRMTCVSEDGDMAQQAQS
jgi:hypothetical protein